MLGSSLSVKVFSNLNTCLEKRGESIEISDFKLLPAALTFSRPFTLPVSAAAESKLPEPAACESSALLGSSE